MTAAIGTVLTCLCIIGLGRSYSLHIKKEIANLRALILLIERIRARIECFRQPLCDIYDGFSNDDLDRIGFTDDLKANGLSFALIKHRGALGLRNDTFLLLNEFALSLGKSYASEQVRICLDVKESLSDRLSQLERELPSKSRLSLTLSAAAAAMTAILFL